MTVVVHDLRGRLRARYVGFSQAVASTEGWRGYLTAACDRTGRNWQRRGGQWEELVTTPLPAGDQPPPRLPYADDAA